MIKNGLSNFVFKLVVKDYGKFIAEVIRNIARNDWYTGKVWQKITDWWLYAQSTAKSTILIDYKKANSKRVKPSLNCIPKFANNRYV